MPILSWFTQQTGLAGIQPSVIYLFTNDTIATVLTSGYLNKYVEDGLSVNTSTMALVQTTTGPIWLQVTIVGLTYSLIVPVGSSDTLRGTANEILVNGGLGPVSGAVTISMPNAVTIPTSLQVGDLFLSADTIATHTVNADLFIVPNGTGVIQFETDIHINDASILKLFDSADDNYVGIKAAGALGATTTYTLPTAYPAFNGYILSSTTAGAMSWIVPPTVTPAALTEVSDTNVTLTLGGTPATALLQATSITAGWSGQLAPSRGGTGVNNTGTITVGGNTAFSGAFTFTGTITGNTTVTFPTTGTLLTAAGAVTSITGTANQITASASVGAVTLSLPTLVSITSAQINDLSIGRFGNADEIQAGASLLLSTNGGGSVDIYSANSAGPVALRMHGTAAGNFAGNYVGIAAPAGAFTTYNLTLPLALPGANNYNLVSSTAGVLSFAAPGISPFAYVSESSATYNVLDASDYFVSVDSSGGARTVKLPNAPAIGAGRTFVIKDQTGSAAAHNITITTVGGAVTIDGVTSYVLNEAYQAISVIFDGANYQVY
jgi:hypothetical protein